MYYHERIEDLFALPETYALAHCISADAALGKGIALQFRKRFDLKSLRQQAREQLLEIGKSYQVGRVFNLVTKARYFHKPTYLTMRQALVSLRAQCQEQGIKQLAIPTLGSGLDKLNWEQVRTIIQNVFVDLDIELIVCLKPETMVEIE